MPKGKGHFRFWMSRQPDSRGGQAGLPAFEKLNWMKLRSREPGHVVGEIGQRLDTNCRWQQCKKYKLCVQGALGKSTWSSGQWRCAKCPGILCTGLTSWVSGSTVAFRNSGPIIPGELGGWPRAPFAGCAILVVCSLGFEPSGPLSISPSWHNGVACSHSTHAASFLWKSFSEWLSDLLWSKMPRTLQNLCSN